MSRFGDCLMLRPGRSKACLLRTTDDLHRLSLPLRRACFDPVVATGFSQSSPPEVSPTVTFIEDTQEEVVVFIIEGMSLRIPAGGLSISIDEAGGQEASVTFHVVYEIWPHWLEIACDHAETANEFRRQLHGVGAGNEDEKGRLLVEECKAAMVGIASSVIGLDAFFAGVCERLPAYPALRSKWVSQKRKPSRSSQVSQVFQRAFRYDPALYSRLRVALKDLYRIRDVAVHPSAGFQPPVQHDILGVGVEWRFATFTATNASKAVSLACDIIQHSIGVPRASLPELGEWCETARTKVGAVYERSTRLAAAMAGQQGGADAGTGASGGQ